MMAARSMSMQRAPAARRGSARDRRVPATAAGQPRERGVVDRLAGDDRRARGAAIARRRSLNTACEVRVGDERRRRGSR